MPDPVPNFWQLAAPEILDAAAGTLDAAHAAAGVADAATLTAEISPRIAGWRAEYLDGQLSADDLASLLRGEQDLAEFDALSRAGATEIVRQRFVLQVLEILARVAVRAVI
jgi:hypothetical protein